MQRVLEFVQAGSRDRRNTSHRGFRHRGIEPWEMLLLSGLPSSSASFQQLMASVFLSSLPSLRRQQGSTSSFTMVSQSPSSLVLLGMKREVPIKEHVYALGGIQQGSLSFTKVF